MKAEFIYVLFQIGWRGPCFVKSLISAFLGGQFSPAVFHFTQNPDILLVVRTVYSTLDANQAVKVHPVRFGVSIAAHGALIPGRLKFGAADPKEEINSVRGNLQL